VEGTPQFSLDSDGDEDIDENDPDLLNELALISKDSEDEAEGEEDAGEESEEKPISQLDLIKARLQMYKTAEANAKAKNESSRARRFNRGVKSLEKLLKRCEGGEIVPYTEIPPEVAINLQPPVEAPAEINSEQQPLAPAISNNATNLQPEDTIRKILPEDGPVDSLSSSPHTQKSSNSKKVIEVEPAPDQMPGEIIETEPSSASPDMNTEHSIERATEQTRLLDQVKCRRDKYKQLALAAKKSGDMSNALNHVRQVKACETLIKNLEAGKEVMETEVPPEPPGRLIQRPAPLPPKQSPQVVDNNIRGGYIFSEPATVQDALVQRLGYYSAELKRAETSGARNEIRINAQKVKIYENAIKLHRKGSELPYGKLPTPPGCPPFPISFKI